MRHFASSLLCSALRCNLWRARALPHPSLLPAAGSLAVAAAAIAKDKVTNLPGFGAPLTDMYSG
jgi:hypothetical protein